MLFWASAEVLGSLWRGVPVLGHRNGHIARAVRRLEGTRTCGSGPFCGRGRLPRTAALRSAKKGPGIRKTKEANYPLPSETLLRKFGHEFLIRNRPRGRNFVASER